MMKYAALFDPALPEKAVKKLKELDVEPLPVPRTKLVDYPVSGHPDLQIFLLNDTVFVHPDIDRFFVKKLSRLCDIRYGTATLKNTYPGDIAYNIAVTGNTAFHLKGATDPVIADYFKIKNISLVHVRQGYSKCSTLIVDDKSIITADTTIHEAAAANGIDSLLVKPGYVDLPGYKYGFLGGASGRLDSNILLTGNIDNHPDRERIYSFITGKGLTVILLSDEPAFDAGSILIIKG